MKEGSHKTEYGLLTYFKTAQQTITLTFLAIVKYIAWKIIFYVPKN